MIKNVFEIRFLKLTCNNKSHYNYNFLHFHIIYENTFNNGNSLGKKQTSSWLSKQKIDLFVDFLLYGCLNFQSFPEMYHLLSGFYKYLFQLDEYYVLILGLDNAGKSVKNNICFLNFGGFN